MFNKSYCNGTKLPKEVENFKEELICEILPIPKQKPDIKNVIDVMVWPEITKYKLIKTQKGYSNEGKKLDGHKLVVEVKLKEKLTYVADECTNAIHGVHYNTIKSVELVLPEEIDGEKVCELVKLNKLNIIPYLEEVFVRKLDCRNAHKCVMLLLNVEVK